MFREIDEAEFVRAPTLHDLAERYLHLAGSGAGGVTHPAAAAAARDLH